MVAPSLLMLSSPCALQAPAEIDASAPSASAIRVFFMCPLLFWLPSMRRQHRGCYLERARNRMGGITLVRVNRPARVDKRPVSATGTKLEQGSQRVLGFLQERQRPRHRLLGGLLLHREADADRADDAGAAGADRHADSPDLALELLLEQRVAPAPRAADQLAHAFLGRDGVG